MRVFCLMTLALTMSACSLFQTRTPIAPPTVSAAELAQIHGIEELLRARNDEEAVRAAEAFEKAHPYSLRLQSVRFLKANALEDLGRWTEAAATYHAIESFSTGSQPDIVALSNYRLSFVYEALGDDQKVLTTLMESQKQKLLPTEILQAEIPSRLAMIYAKENNAVEAQKWLLAADEGLRRTLDSHRGPLTKQWLAEIYFNMGSISTEQISEDNILTLIQGQRAVQKYLIHALQFEDPEWSAKADERLKETYQNLWRVIERAPEPTGFEAPVALKMKSDAQMKVAVPLVDLVREAQLYRPGPDQAANSYQSDFFQFLDQMQGRLLTVLESPYYTPLTKKTEGAPQKQKVPAKIVPSEDPNL